MQNTPGWKPIRGCFLWFLRYVLAPTAHSISPPTHPLRPRGDRPFAGGSRVRPHPLLFSGRPCSALDKLERWAYNAFN